MSRAEEFSELMESVQYASKKVCIKEWNLSEYYIYMADFFDYIEMPEDAEEHRLLSKTWELENLE